jgi:hypothetical protein
MKIWHGYGSEHSANLVMIGRFKTIEAAHRAKDAIDQLAKQYATDASEASETEAEGSDRYSDAMLDVMQNVRVHNVGPAELEQLNLDINVKLDGNEIQITTDEIEVSAFLKILIDKGAKLEVYSAHDYPDEDKSNKAS